MARSGPTALAIVHHSGAFDRVVFTPSVRGGTIAAYWLDQTTEAEGPYDFYLEWAEHPEADFIEVAGPSDSGVLVDGTARRYSKLQHSVYRVRLDAATGTYYSDEMYATGNLNRHDFLIAREIVRREYLALASYTGTQGMLLARKQWGELCPRCTDYDTDMPSDAHCPVCYSVGFTGGYHNLSTLWFGEERIGLRAARQDGVGVRADQKQAVRAVACPFLTAKDVWVNLSTDERWSIESKQELASLRGKPLIYGVEIRLIEPGNIAYDVPLTEVTSSSSQ